jgi:hypothetical protein
MESHSAAMLQHVRREAVLLVTTGVFPSNVQSPTLPKTPCTSKRRAIFFAPGCTWEEVKEKVVSGRTTGRYATPTHNIYTHDHGCLYHAWDYQS